MDSDEKEMVSLDDQFRFCEQVIEDFESGKWSTAELQKRLKDCTEKLENLTREVSARSLFSENETVNELPTSSLQYMLIPAYLATTAQNTTTEPEHRLEALDKAKVYLRDFLERLLSYEIIGFELPWLNEDLEEDRKVGPTYKPSPAEVRESKIKRYEQEKQLKENIERLKAERTKNCDDESLLRDLLLLRLRLFALKAMNELEQIEQERPFAEHMLKLRSGQIQPEPKKAPPPSKPPLIITRDALQKKVFGLGYPSVPTVTVDEWFDDMVKHGRFGNMEKGSSNAAAGDTKTDEDSDNEAAEEGRRARAQRWDEYKDTHRRGWGNTHNKG